MASMISSTLITELEKVIKTDLLKKTIRKISRNFIEFKRKHLKYNKVSFTNIVFKQSNRTDILSSARSNLG